MQSNYAVEMIESITPEAPAPRGTSEIRLTKCAQGHDGSSVLVVFPEYQIGDSAAKQLVQGLGNEFTNYVLTSPLPAVNHVHQFTTEILESFARIRIKRATILGLGSGATICQALAVASPKLVRRVVLVDASARIRPSFFTKCIDRIEHYLPLGLPLRKLTDDYDSRSELHRIRCPVLLLSSPRAHHFEQRQTRLLSKRIPNSWMRVLAEPAVGVNHSLSAEVMHHLHEFLQVPTKRPQK